jgi:hypothetical protein
MSSAMFWSGTPVASPAPAFHLVGDATSASRIAVAKGTLVVSGCWNDDCIRSMVLHAFDAWLLDNCPKSVHSVGLAFYADSQRITFTPLERDPHGQYEFSMRPGVLHVERPAIGGTTFDFSPHDQVYILYTAADLRCRVTPATNTPEVSKRFTRQFRAPLLFCGDIALGSLTEMMPKGVLAIGDRKYLVLGNEDGFAVYQLSANDAQQVFRRSLPKDLFGHYYCN